MNVDLISSAARWKLLAHRDGRRVVRKLNRYTQYLSNCIPSVQALDQGLGQGPFIDCVHTRPQHVFMSANFERTCCSTVYSSIVVKGNLLTDESVHPCRHIFLNILTTSIEPNLVHSLSQALENEISSVYITFSMQDTASWATSFPEQQDEECSVSVFSQGSTGSSSSSLDIQQQRFVPVVAYQTLLTSSAELVRRSFAASGLGAIIVTDIPSYCVHRNSLLPLAHQVLAGCHITSVVRFYPVTHSVRRQSLYVLSTPVTKQLLFPLHFSVAAQTAAAGEAICRGFQELLPAGLAPLFCLEPNRWRPEYCGEFTLQICMDNLV